MARGKELIDQVVNATGLPAEMVKTELMSSIQKEGKDPETLELDDLRLVLASFLQDVLSDAKEEYSKSS